MDKEKVSTCNKISQEFQVKSCSIHSVVVYKDRAEVSRNIPLYLTKGESEVVLTGLSECVDSESIRVEGRGHATIQDVVYDSSKLDDKEKQEAYDNSYKALMESIEEKERELKGAKFRKALVERQKSMLREYADHVTSWSRLPGKNEDEFQSNIEPHTVAGVVEFMTLYQERKTSLDERLIEFDSHFVKIESELAVLRAKARKLVDSAKVDYVRSVKVILDAKEEGDIVLIVSYVVNNASWTPCYDVRVFSKDKTMKLHYYGMIKQSTGEDWENANIALSTAQPDVGGSPPRLGVHYIGFKSYYVATGLASLKKKGKMKKKNTRGGKSRSYDDDGLRYSITMYEQDESEEEGETQLMNAGFLGGGTVRDKSGAAPRSSRRRRRSLASFSDGSYESFNSEQSLDVDVTKVDTVQLYNTCYTIPRTATIPADDTEHKVTVAILDLSPEFYYISVPRLSPGTFLQAVVNNESEYTLLGGPANVFLDNNFLAKSDIPNTSPNEEFTSSLGSDESVRITCQPMKIVRGTTGRITKYHLLTYTFSYSVKNTQANVVKVKVKEQIPLSTDDKLKVSIIQPELRKRNVKVPFSHGHTMLNCDNNAEWYCTLPADTSVDLQLVYSVEFPPNDVVMGLPST